MCVNCGINSCGCSGKDTLVPVIGLPGTDGTNGINGTDGANGINGTDGTDGTNGVNGINGIDGASVLHNDFTTYNGLATDVFSQKTSYTLPAGTLATNGSLLKIKLLFKNNPSLLKRAPACQLWIGGAVAHLNVGGSPSQFISPQADVTVYSMLEYTFNRKSNSQAVIDFKYVPMMEFQGVNYLSGHQTLETPFDFDGADTYISVFTKNELDLQRFTVENYIK